MKTLFPVTMLAAAVATMSFAANCAAATFIVNNGVDAPDDNPGNGVCHPVNGAANTCTLRAAIMEANALGGSHSIALPSGQYVLNRLGAGEDAASTGDLDITAAITIVNGTSNLPVIFSADQDRVFDVRPGGSLTVQNLAVAGGFANQVGTVRGGAFQVGVGAQLSVERSIISGNIANQGGAIYSDGSVNIVDSEFYNNAIVDDLLLGEFAVGSAVFSRGVLTIERSTFRNNGSIPGGDGLNFVLSAHVIHTRQTGPALPSTTMVNTTIADNTRGIRSEGVPLKLDMVTIAGNGGLGLRYTPDLANLGVAQLQVRQTVIVNHTSSDCNGIDGTTAENSVSNRYNASADASCGFTGVLDKQNIAYPFLDSMESYGGRTPVLMPKFSSEIVDAGGGLCLPSSEDQRGKSRPIDGDLNGHSSCDLGAVEFDSMTDPLNNDTIFAHGFE